MPGARVVARVPTSSAHVGAAIRTALTPDVGPPSGARNCRPRTTPQARPRLSALPVPPRSRCSRRGRRPRPPAAPGAALGCLRHPLRRMGRDPAPEGPQQRAEVKGGPRRRVLDGATVSHGRTRQGLEVSDLVARHAEQRSVGPRHASSGRAVGNPPPGLLPRRRRRQDARRGSASWQARAVAEPRRGPGTSQAAARPRLGRGCGDTRGWSRRRRRPRRGEIHCAGLRVHRDSEHRLGAALSDRGRRAEPQKLRGFCRVRRRTGARVRRPRRPLAVFGRSRSLSPAAAPAGPAAVA